MASTDELTGFVRQALERGIPRAEITAALTRAGWDRERSTAALAAFADVEFALPVPRPRPYVSAREAFLYLVLFTTLYITAINVGTVAFQFIDLAYPDPASRFTALPFMKSAMRWSISSLIVAFPIFLLLSRLTSRELRQDPGRRASKVRRWLIYLTLFNAAGVLIGDVIALIYNFLGGELTPRFVLKALAIGIIAAAAFGYYLTLVRQDEHEDTRWRRVAQLLGYVSVAAVLAAIAGGVVIQGSPVAARRERLDQRRVADLRQINQSVNVFWTRTKGLPESIDELVRQSGVSLATADPVTRQSYVYEVLSADRYRLCATFDGDSSQTDANPPSFWTHRAGRQCFELGAKEVKPW